MLHVLKIGAPANVHLKLVSHSNRSDVDLNKINVSWALYSAKCDTNKPDGYIIEISSSRSFPENETGIEYYKNYFWVSKQICNFASRQKHTKYSIFGAGAKFYKYNIGCKRLGARYLTIQGQFRLQ